MMQKEVVHNNSINGVESLTRKPNSFCSPKKVVFAEPYEIVPNYYIDNNFKKGNCDCIPKPKKEGCCFPNFNLDLKSILPVMLSLLGGGKGDLTKFLGALGTDKSNPIMSILSNKDVMNMVGNLFSKKKKTTSEKIKSTENDIKNYVKV